MGGIKAGRRLAQPCSAPQSSLDLLSTKEINLPVLPPTLPKAVRAPAPALKRADPAELVTRLRPSEALETDVEAASFTLAAVSAVVEACRTLCCRRRTNLDWRSSARDVGAAGMVVGPLISAPRAMDEEQECCEVQHLPAALVFSGAGREV